MKRRLFNLAVVLSFVLCLTIAAAIVVQWGRSSRGGEMIARNSIRVEPGRIIINRRAWSTPGTLDLDWNEETQDTSDFASVGTTPKENWVHRRYDGDRGQLTRTGGDAPPVLARAGLTWSSGRSPGSGPNVQGRFVWVRVQYSFLLAVAIAMTVLPALGLWRIIRRSRRRRAGLCPACGYDLRATPERCPECGVALHEPPHNPPMQRTATASSGAVE